MLRSGTCSASSSRSAPPAMSSSSKGWAFGAEASSTPSRPRGLSARRAVAAGVLRRRGLVRRGLARLPAAVAGAHRVRVADRFLARRTGARRLVAPAALILYPRAARRRPRQRRCVDATGAGLPSPSSSPSVAPSGIPSPCSRSSPHSAASPAAMFQWTDPHALVVLGDGLCPDGGRGRGYGTAGLDPDSASAGWKAVEPLPKARSGFAMVTLPDGRALVVGGLNDQGQSYSSSYAFIRRPRPGRRPRSWPPLAPTGRGRPARRARADRRRLLPAVQRSEWAIDPSSAPTPSSGTRSVRSSRAAAGMSTFRISAMPSLLPRCMTRRRTPSPRPDR